MRHGDMSGEFLVYGFHHLTEQFAVRRRIFQAVIQYIKDRFEVFNKQMFGGALPLPVIRVSKAKTYLGAVTYKRKRTWYGKVVISDFKLCISARYELSESLLEDTIIHEMIHYYIIAVR